MQCNFFTKTFLLFDWFWLANGTLYQVVLVFFKFPTHEQTEKVKSFLLFVSFSKDNIFGALGGWIFSSLMLLSLRRLSSHQSQVKTRFK